jgi:hypothetical protein
MNATEVNTELNKLLARAVNEGVVPNKIPFEHLVGIIESHKYNLLNWRAAQLAAITSAQEAKSGIVLPNGRLPHQP